MHLKDYEVIKSIVLTSQPKVTVQMTEYIDDLMYN